MVDAHGKPLRPRNCVVIQPHAVATFPPEAQKSVRPPEERETLERYQPGGPFSMSARSMETG